MHNNLTNNNEGKMKNIKKILTLFMIITLISLSVACSKNNSEQVVPDNNQDISDVSDDNVEAVELEAVYLGYGTYFITKVNQNAFNHLANDLLSIDLPQGTTEPTIGTRVALNIEPIIRESYPAQASAVEIRISEDKPSVIKADLTWGANSLLMHLPENTHLIDVRTEEEFQEGHIPGSTLLPLNELTDRISEIVPGQNDIVLVYCRSGNRSATAAKNLIDLGYQIVFDLGGINSYQGDLEY